MMRKHFLTAAVMAIVVAFVGQSQASIIYSQALTATPETQYGYNSNNDGTGRVADDFTIASSGSLNSVSWYGIYAGGLVPGASKSFSISVYDDLTAGSLISQQTVSILGVNTSLNNSATNSILSYTAAIAPVALASGNYLLEIVEVDSTTSNLWAWQTSDQGNASIYKRDQPGDVFTSVGVVSEKNGLAFSVTLAEIEAVPEPASCVIWGALGIAGLVAARRRKKVAA